MRIYLSADIEGVAGVTHLPTTGPGRFEYDLGRKWMTGEVVAAIAGARAAGAGEIVVSDGHGTAHNILLDSLPEDVRVVRSWPRPLIQMDGIEQGHFDAVVLVGHHASAKAERGILSHTFTNTFADIRLNGVSQSETSLNALLAAHYGAPVIFSSGDDDYIAHCLEILPDLETVVTKRAISYTASENLLPAESCRRIEAGVRRAVERRSGMRGLVQPDVFVVECDFQLRSQPEMLDYLPWLERTGPFTIRCQLKDVVEVMRFIAFAAFYKADGLPRYGEGTA